LTDESEISSHYHFRVSLRFRHPSADPEVITRALNIEPRRSWKAGEPRRTPTGSPLKGLNDITYWYVDVAAGRYPTRLKDTVLEVLHRLVHHREFLHQMRSEGGSAELFIGWFFERQSGDVLSYDLLALAGDLQIDLSVAAREHKSQEPITSHFRDQIG
jgi:hypothetical protein